MIGGCMQLQIEWLHITKFILVELVARLDQISLQLKKWKGYKGGLKSYYQ